MFVDASHPDRLRRDITRFIELLFGNTFHTPTRNEYAMFHAHANALRSASLGRQVGAVIATDDGDIIAVGTNEVPKAGGGLYGPEDVQDYRDFVLGKDTNYAKKKQLLGDLLQRLIQEKWLTAEKRQRRTDALVEEALGTKSPFLAEARLMDLIEFVREVHAEMAALIDASRRTVQVKGCTLYSTTFPCHECAKHIIAAGIRRVAYIDPYPKSIAQELFFDSISVYKPETPGNVSFQPFVGVSHRLYMNLFTKLKRKDDDGNVIYWNPLRAMPRMSGSVYIPKEYENLAVLRKAMRKKGLIV